MRTVELPNMTQDEIDMLDGLAGQMSDGAGENLGWCDKYWKYMDKFENRDGKSYFNFIDDGAFKGKTDAAVIKLIGEKFNKICVELNSVPDCGPELFYDDDRRRKLQHHVAKSVVLKLTGKDDYHTPTMEELRAIARRFYGWF